ncbi:MAG: cyclic nucleotide-binding domain-containing protein [Xanthomonadales bacterium]|nr:cyclic nucleotide-binding domain-containing protein [Xanthomonadales bacterium]
MKTTGKMLRSTRLFGAMSPRQLDSLLEESEIKYLAAGDTLVDDNNQLQNHLAVIEGTLEAQRSWTTADDKEKSYTWILTPQDTEGGIALLSASTRQVRVRAVTDVRYIEISADRADEFIGWVQHVSNEIGDNPILQSRMELTSHISVFSHLPLHNITRALKVFKGRTADAHETIVTQGDKGTAYYIIEEGQAKVTRTDPLTDETGTVVTLGPGDAFGEEALLQDGFRNATVEMITPGSLLVMEKQDFDKLVEPGMAEEIEAGEAQAQLSDHRAILLDCRYDMEFEESRIPGATHIALDHLRVDIHTLNPDADYIVYCRSGRRSLAATFILGERNINAKSLKGGIKNWPYKVDTNPPDDRS